MYENYMFNQYYKPPQQIIRVTGMEGAKAYNQLGANSSVALFDENEDIFYVKSTDGASFPTIRAFKFEPLVTQPEVPQGDYVTRKEFEELKGMILNGKQSVRKQNKSESAGTVDADA